MKKATKQNKRKNRATSRKMLMFALAFVFACTAFVGLFAHEERAAAAPSDITIEYEYTSETLFTVRFDWSKTYFDDSINYTGKAVIKGTFKTGGSSITIYEDSGTGGRFNGGGVAAELSNYQDYFISFNSYTIEITFNTIVFKQSITFVYNDVKPVVPLPADPVKEGHTFVGWYLDSALTQPYDGRDLYEDTALYAKFKIDQYKVTFNSNGGLAISPVTIDWGDSFTALPTPTRAGYVFKGWTLDGIEYPGSMVFRDITLVAQWELIYLNITFYIGDNVYDVISVPYGATLAEAVAVAQTNSIVFTGLYTDENLHNAVGTSAVLTKDVAIYTEVSDDSTDNIFDGVTDWVIENQNYLYIAGGGLLSIAAVLIIYKIKVR